MSEIVVALAIVALVVAWRAHSRISALEARIAILTRSAGAEEGADEGEAEGWPLESPPDPRAEPGAAGFDTPLTEPDAAADPAFDAARGQARPAGAWPNARAQQAAGQNGGQNGGQGATLGHLGGWLRDNWIYPVAGAALFMAGIFLVQYSVERGLLTPQARIVLALVMALALAAAGEWLRRRPAAGRILPATLAGAGIAIAMAAVLGALHLYAMIGPATALIALALLAFGAIALGWLHGPMLAALGLVAGTAAPFLLGGGGPPPPALFGYFALLALAGMGIDAARRWGWVTWLAVAGPMGGMILWRVAGGDALALTLALLVVAAAAMTLPFGRVMPLVEGPRALGRARPAQGVRASFVASAVAAGTLALTVPGLAGPVGLIALAGLIAIWCRRAPALSDQMILPLLALPLWIFWQDATWGPVLRAFDTPLRPEAPIPLHASLILALATLAGLAYLWRGETEAPGRHAPWTLAGLAFPGAAIVALETLWQPAPQIGAYVWALHAMALAALATGMALRYAARDEGRGPRLGASAAAAFAFVALGLMLVFGQAALTLALAVLMIGAAAMDRRFDIPALGAFQVLATMVLLWRLVLDPGMGWLMVDASLPAMLLSLVATLGGPLGALWLGQGLPDDPLRRYTQVIVETTLTAAAAIAAAILFVRLLPDRIGPHALLGLQASVLILLAWVQVRRMALPVLPRVRQVLAYGLSALASLALAGALFPMSPLLGEGFLSGRVAGWPLVNDLMLAYLLPGLLLIRLGGWPALRIAGWALVAVWAALAIRHLWQGPSMGLSRGIAQGELYAYTFALLVAGAVLLARAVLTRRSDLRKAGLALVGLAAAKAFLVDVSGLDGLLRVGGFLALGLSLAGLAWVNGWALAREGHPPEGPVAEPAEPAEPKA